MLEPETAACSEASIEVGGVVAEQYVVRSILGRGGMGVVCEAEHRERKERVAVKLLIAGRNRLPVARARFMREARITAELKGEHATRLRDFGVLADDTPYMVMEYLEGLDLKRLLLERLYLPVDLAVAYAMQACLGLAEAHALGIVHRDLKPSNLFLTKRADGSDLIKLLDFGVSKVFLSTGKDDDITAAGSVVGSPRYMAPEQLVDAVSVDARADIWSLGAVLYEMLAGHPPYMAENPAELCHNILGGERPSPLARRVRGVSPELEAVVSACMDRRLESRISDVALLARRLSDVTKIEGLDAQAARVEGILRAGGTLEGRQRIGSASRELEAESPSKQGAKRPRRVPRWVWISVAGTVILALVGAGWVQLQGRGTTGSTAPSVSDVVGARESGVAPAQSAAPAWSTGTAASASSSSSSGGVHGSPCPDAERGE